MITEAQITELVEQKLADTDFFIVDISVQPGNKISVELDGNDGFPISECVNFSRHIEFSLDREAEDFSLQVSSPGLSKPFKVYQQYVKNVGRSLNVKLQNGDKLKGKLIDVSEEKIELESRSKERLEGKKKKVEVVHVTTVNMEDIKESKLVIEF